MSTIKVVMEGQEFDYDSADFNVSMDTPDAQIITALSGSVSEQFGVSISSGLYAVIKVSLTDTIFITPKSPQG